MNLILKPLVAGLLTAASLAAVSAQAEDLDPSHVVRDVAGRDTAPVTALQLELGPQYTVNDKLSVGGEWERFEPFDITGLPNIEQYSFGFRVSY
jgi:hypothetical protein